MHPSGKQIQNPIENETTNLFRFDDDGFVCGKYLFPANQIQIKT